MILDKEIESEGSDEEGQPQDSDFDEEIKPVANVEPFVPREMNEEDRKLVEKMSSILDSSTKDLLEGEDE